MTDLIVLLAQRIEQHPGLLQSRRVEPCGEPDVNQGEQRPRFSLLALLLPESAEALGE